MQEFGCACAWLLFIWLAHFVRSAICDLTIFCSLEVNYNHLAFPFVLAVRAEKLPRCTLLTLSRPNESAVLIFATLASFLAHRAVYRCRLSRTNRGVSEGSRWTALTDRATVWSTTCFSASEADVLGERESQNGYTSRLAILEDVAGNPSVRKKKCPATPCVPARRD
jgi:hypothetical protein